MKNTGGDPVKIIEEKGLKQKSDPKELELIVAKIIEDNKDKVNQYKAGKEKLFGFFVGQTMKVSGGTANPQLVNDILKKKLK
jgi:aspartyl-tRNA(Asn)/glutamyl-tRNA(Gln) amidotransferase subunit B